MATHVYDERTRLAPPTVSGLRATAASLAPALHALLRIGAGLLFMEHGMQKLFGMFGMHPVHLYSLMGLAGVLEFGGGLLIALGLLTRPVAFLLAGEMVAAFFMAHFSVHNPVPLQNKGELALLYALVWAYF